MVDDSSAAIETVKINYQVRAGCQADVVLREDSIKGNNAAKNEAMQNGRPPDRGTAASR